MPLIPGIKEDAGDLGVCSEPLPAPLCQHCENWFLSYSWELAPRDPYLCEGEARDLGAGDTRHRLSQGPAPHTAGHRQNATQEPAGLTLAQGLRLLHVPNFPQPICFSTGNDAHVTLETGWRASAR